MVAIILLAAFLLLMIVVGFWGLGKTSSLNDFFLGGRSVGPWISAFAYGTTYFSAVLFIGFAGKLGWGFGLNVLWIALGNAVVGGCLAWMVLGRRTRRMSQNLDAMTMPEFLQARFQDPALKIVAALIVFVFLLPYSASVFKGLGHLFAINFSISYDLALLIMIGITGVYLVLGGYFAITLTDFIQGIIMIAGSLAMISVITGRAGGLAAAIGRVLEAYPQHVPPGKQPGFLMLFSLVFMTSFGPWGLPQMVQKFYAIKDERVIRTATIVTTVFALIIVFSAYLNGALSHVFFNAPPAVNGRVDFDRLIPELLKSQLPGGLMAIILLLVLSASMSTLSSLVLVSASAVAIDLCQGQIRPDPKKKSSLALMRVLSGLFVILSYLIARYELGIIVTLMSLSWGAVAGSFMAPLLYGLYWKRATRAGIWAGMLTGLVLAVSLFFILGPANSPIASTIAMIAPFLVVPLASAVTPPPDTDVLRRAFERISRPMLKSGVL